MAEDSDSPAMKALFVAAIESESAREFASRDSDWHATLSDMLPTGLRDPPFLGSHASLQQKNGPLPSRVHHGQGRNRYKQNVPVKTVPPPKAVSVSGSSLTERIESLRKHALVGKWYFPEMNEEEMRNWISTTWIPIIGYAPIISRLMKDWFSFHFQKESDLELALSRPWVSGRSFLSLSRWYLGFDPLKNTPSHSMIWVKLPNLPLELWTMEILALIGNAIGKFIYVDPWVRGEKDKRIAWILIDIPYKGGYPDQIDITWDGAKICQRLDFWGIPFRCSSCH